MATDFGSGIYLTSIYDEPPTWDMQVTNSGDIRTVSGPDELEKDLSLSTAVRIGPALGSHITPVTRNRIRARVLDAFDDDTRINSVLVLEVNEVTGDSDTLEIVAEVNAVEDEDIELVFEVAR